MTQNKHFYIVSYLFLVAFLHMNAILKAEDPIADTQTEAILYDQKMEQEKDGVKGPATPKMIYYGGQGFLTKSSLSKYEKEIAGAREGIKKDKFSWSDWWEDKPAETQSPSGEEAPQITDVLPELPQSLEGAETDSAGVTPLKGEPQAKKTEQKMSVEEGIGGERPSNVEDSDTDASSLATDSDPKHGDDWW